MLYDLIAFYFRRTSDLAFALCAHASKYMDARQLRDTGDYFKALAENRIVTTNSKTEGTTRWTT